MPIILNFFTYPDCEKKSNETIKLKILMKKLKDWSTKYKVFYQENLINQFFIWIYIVIFN